MDIIEFITSINQIAIISFIITLVFLVYEVWMMQRDKNKKKQPTVPQFNPLSTVPQSTDQLKQAPVAQNQKPADDHTVKNFHKFIFPILFGMLLLFGMISVIGMLNSRQPKTTSTQQTSQPVQEVKSTGIKIFDNRWVEITEDASNALREGDLLYIGVVSVRNANIDMARVKINETAWLPKHTTTKYNPAFNLYYREYVLSATDKKLEIEAQLHSKTEGWLSE